MDERVAVDAEAEMRLVGVLAVDLHLRARAVYGGRRRVAGLGGLEVAEQALDRAEVIAVELARDADDHPFRLVPAAGVVEERLALCPADRLLAADDVPAERLVAVEELLVDAADEVARRVEVHVHLLDDHALLAVDLLRLELRVAEHVGEHVERLIAVVGGAADVVARVLLAREGVELAAEAVDLHADVARGRTALGALEEHVLGEMRDPVRLGSLVARAGGEHDHAGDRLHLRHARAQDPQAVVQLMPLKIHAAILSRQSSGIAIVSPVP